MECVAARHGIDSSGEIMGLNQFCPWKLHSFELEEMKIEPSIKYVLYQDARSKKWRVPAIAVAPDRFQSRKALPAQCCGLRDDELSKGPGILGCVFVHMSGFIGGNQTYEGALSRWPEAQFKALSTKKIGFTISWGGSFSEHHVS